MKAAIYCRVSTDEQAERGTSLSTQEERCRAHVAAQDWEIFEVYVDAGGGWGRRAHAPPSTS